MNEHNYFNGGNIVFYDVGVHPGAELAGLFQPDLFC